MTTFKKVLYAIAGTVLIAGGLCACSPLGVVNALSTGNALQAESDVAYGLKSRQRLDIYRPASASHSSPVIVFFYGGNWNSGERADYAFVGRALAKRGFVVVIPDYRLYPEVRYPDFLSDSAAAVAWTVREINNYGGDASRLFVMGHSAGAYNAAMVALDPALLAKVGVKPGVVRGLIGLAGPYNFLPVSNVDTRPVFNYPNTPADSQPINHVSKSSPPALLIAANKDNLVDPVRNTGALAAAMRATGVPVREVYFDGVNHVTLLGSLSASLKALAPTLDAVEAFVDSDGGRKK
ncbi:MAG: alpha/beta hydrolase [Pseudomonadota bacterium]|nr:alpha/beta hydrolase [Pseudomonadota bacterium]